MQITKRTPKGQIAKGSNLSHGLSDDPVYDCWVAMKARCFKEHHPNYRQYGGRGITVCDRWAHSFENFLGDMGAKPSSKHTIDRIDVNGNYEPTNCRWITIQEQQKNKRCSNEVVGVSWEKSRNKWTASIRAYGKRYFLGRFKSLEDARRAREQAELKLWVCL